MTPLDPSATAALALAAAYVLVGAGVSMKQLVWRIRRCQSCGRPMPLCTCHWR